MRTAAQGDSLRSGTSDRSDSGRSSVVLSLPAVGSAEAPSLESSGSKTRRKGIWHKSHSGAEELGENQEIAAGRGAIRFAPPWGIRGQLPMFPIFSFAWVKNPAPTRVLRNYLSRQGEGESCGGSG